MSVTQKVKGYIRTWESRCYSDSGIPDEIPPSIEKTLRVPSYKAIAKAILKNDHQLLTLGFTRKETDLSKALHSMSLEKEVLAQMGLFDE